MFSMLILYSSKLHLNIQSNPSILPIFGLAKKRRYSEMAVLGVIYNLQNPYLGLGNGRRYWEGGGIGRGGIEGDDCINTTR